MNMETQCGPNDCGVYVSAMMTSIAYGEDPCYLSYNYNPKTMQHHLAQCFEMHLSNHHLEWSVRSREVCTILAKAEVHAHVYYVCMCNDMLQCIVFT